MTKFIVVAILAAGFLGCGQQIKDFVRGTDPSPTPVIQPPPIITTIASDKAMTISPGHLDATGTGTQVDGTMTLTPHARTVTGSQVDATVSFHQQRVK